MCEPMPFPCHQQQQTGVTVILAKQSMAREYAKKDVIGKKVNYHMIINHDAGMVVTE